MSDAVPVSPPTAPAVSCWKSRRTQLVAIFLIGAVCAAALMVGDILIRARHAFLQGERYMAWATDPAGKAKFFDDKYQRDKAALDAKRKKENLTEADYQQRLESLGSERDFAIQESSLKYAYQWYKDTYQLFSPPESRWSREARRKAPEALELWKQELRNRGVSFDDATLE